MLNPCMGTNIALNLYLLKHYLKPAGLPSTQYNLTLLPLYFHVFKLRRGGRFVRAQEVTLRDSTKVSFQCSTNFVKIRITAYVH